MATSQPSVSRAELEHAISALLKARLVEEQWSLAVHRRTTRVIPSDLKNNFLKASRKCSAAQKHLDDLLSRLYPDDSSGSVKEKQLCA